jgi:hypothetical protein
MDLGHERDRWAAAATAAVTAIARWRETHPQASWTEIEAAVDAEWDAVRAQVLTEAAQASAAASFAGRGDRPRCPACRGRLWANGAKLRQVVTWRGGVITLRRSHGWCPRCGTGVFPPGCRARVGTGAVESAGGSGDRGAGHAAAL